MSVSIKVSTVMTQISAILLIGMLSGCHSGYSPEQERSALWLVETDTFIDDHLDTPARYMVEVLRQCQVELKILKSGGGPEYTDTVRRMSRVADNIRIGLNWTLPRTKCQISRRTAPPRIDGIISPGEWDGEELFRGEFAINSTQPFSGEKDSRWFAGWDQQYLYFAARFRDDDIIAWNGHSYGHGSKKALYNADCLELFIRPFPRFKLYYEFLINPDGDTWELLHCHLNKGRWERVCDDHSYGLLSAVTNRNGITEYELAIPFRMLYGDWTLRGPRTGDRFDFMPIRINRGKNSFRRTVPVPLLYDGHNIFGYLDGTLGN